uniref:arrestin domain-containing protein 3-like n=1 Tax=Scatophagus argus TaxID=75038 RepID=UPI001ED8420D|nr:arrestin domain-containing protein 3-like [Scatophagus argus]
MSPIKDLSVIYEALNGEYVFSEGDTVAGAVTFTLLKETKVTSIVAKVKGDARVSWTEEHDEGTSCFSEHKRVLKVKEHLVARSPKGVVLAPGAHCFNFRVKIPQGDLPSSFYGLYGNIIYVLEAKVSRNWRWPSAVQRELKFVSKFLSHHGQVKCRRCASKGKEVAVFSKGKVKMSATIDRKVCSPGDTLSIVVKICNLSSKQMRPKFSLQQEIKYSTEGSTNITDTTLRTKVGETLKFNSEETISCIMDIPVKVIHTMHSCKIISVDHYLKVYLDISLKHDPELRFPLVIVPSNVATHQPGEAAGPYPAGAVGAPSYSDSLPPAFPGGPYPVPAGPSAYGYPAPDPTQRANAASGYNNQLPQQVAPSAFLAAAFPPPSVQRQTPTASTAFQQGEPPTYSSLFPASHGTYGSKKHK